MLNCASIIVTYFPNAESIENIIKVSSLCAKVFVVDNTPGACLIGFQQISNVVILRFHSNLGVSAALNKGIRSAGDGGFKDIFLFDQDSYVPENFFHDMLSFKAKVDTTESNCALYVPNFRDRNTRTFAGFPLLRGIRLKTGKCEDTRSLRKDYSAIAITSGSLITYEKYKRIGPFREDYFIDFIDNEYCLRLQKMGLRIAINCDVVLDHAIGRRSKREWLGITIKPNDHKPVRRYYIARNGLRTAIDFVGVYPSYAFLLFLRMIHESISILFYERNKVKKIVALIWGCYHGVIGRMGKCKIKLLFSR